RMGSMRMLAVGLEQPGRNARKRRMTSMRMLAVVTCVVLAGASQAMALPGLLGTSFSQSYSTASGLSKITFKRTASRGSLDAQVFIAELDPCGRALGLGGPGLEVDITNSLGLYGLTLAPPSALWATKCTIDLPGTDGAGTDSGSLDTGQCKIRFKVTVDASFLVTH